MKIGIFGDSYASDKKLNPTDSINSNFLDLNLDDFVCPLDKDFYIKKYE
jgi:hypothetical protein